MQPLKGNFFAWICLDEAWPTKKEQQTKRKASMLACIANDTENNSKYNQQLSNMRAVREKRIDEKKKEKT
jgi:hypothetical protein